MDANNLVNNNVSTLNGESSGMDTTNLVQSNITKQIPFSSYSVLFNGVDDYFDLGTLQGTTLQPDDATLISNGLSVSIWVNLNSLGDEGVWQNDGLGQADYAGLSLAIKPAGELNIGYGDNTGAASSDRLNYVTTAGHITSINTWYHIVAIFKGMGSTGSPVAQGLYVNGVEITAFDPPTGSSSTLAYSASAKGSIGVIRNGTVCLDGKISNCAVFDRTITQDEVLNIYNNGVPQDIQQSSSFSNNVIGWWPMDQSYTYFDGSVLIARDVINGNDGTGVNVIQENIIGNAPGSTSNGTGTNLDLSDLIGDMKDSKLNAYSINMADYADGVVNPANSGRSTEIPQI